MALLELPLKHNPRLVLYSAGYENLLYAQRASQCMSSSPSQVRPNKKGQAQLTHRRA